jgi:DNA-binding response OmpR family regulator
VSASLEPTSELSTGEGYRTYDASVTDRLLIVEDDPAIGRNLSRMLNAEGYDCQLVTTVAEARAVETAPDLAIMDLGLPDGDGLDLARELLIDWPTLPIIMLTARAEELDIVIGLDAGAIDYMTKPFRLAELLARVRAQLRKPEGGGARREIRDGSLLVQLDARRVFLDGEEIEMRAREFDLMIALLQNRGAVVSREDLMSRVWDEHWFGSTKTLDVHIAAVRRRLGERADQESRIATIRGVGYRWNDAVGSD